MHLNNRKSYSFCCIKNSYRGVSISARIYHDCIKAAISLLNPIYKVTLMIRLITLTANTLFTAWIFCFTQYWEISTTAPPAIPVSAAVTKVLTLLA